MRRRRRAVRRSRALRRRPLWRRRTLPVRGALRMWMRRRRGLWWLLVLGLHGTLLVSPWVRLGVGLLAGAMPASVGILCLPDVEVLCHFASRQARHLESG